MGPANRSVKLFRSPDCLPHIARVVLDRLDRFTTLVVVLASVQLLSGHGRKIRLVQATEPQRELWVTQRLVSQVGSPVPLLTSHCVGDLFLLCHAGSELVVAQRDRSIKGRLIGHVEMVIDLGKKKQVVLNEEVWDGELD